MLAISGRRHAGELRVSRERCILDRLQAPVVGVQLSARNGTVQPVRGVEVDAQGRLYGNAGWAGRYCQVSGANDAGGVATARIDSIAADSVGTEVGRVHVLAARVDGNR